MSDQLNKWKEFLDSPEGQKSIEDWAKKHAIEQQITESQMERFWAKYQNNLNEIIEKVIAKYRTDKYRDSWYNRGIEPPEHLFSFLLKVGERYGRELTDEEYRQKENLMFTAVIYRLGEWDIELIQGQGSAVLVYKHSAE